MKISQLTFSGAVFLSLFATTTWAMELADDNLLKEILAKLPPKDLVKVTAVSKQWQRISEEDSLWQINGFSSKKECIAFPLTTLERKHLKTLFKHKYLSANEVFFWKLREKVETPEEVFKDIDSMPPGSQPLRWVEKNVQCTKKEPNLVQFTTEIIFSAEIPVFCTVYTKVPYTLTFFGSWDIEEKLPF